MSALSELREALEYAGLKTESAERIAYALQTREFMRIDLATKEDVYKLESKIDNNKAELKEEIQQVRTELKEEIQQVRTELKEEIQQVRTELKEDINRLDKKIDNVKAELKEDIQEVKKETLLLRAELTKQENKILWFFASGIGLVILSQILLNFLK